MVATHPKLAANWLSFLVFWCVALCLPGVLVHCNVLLRGCIVAVLDTPCRRMRLAGRCCSEATVVPVVTESSFPAARARLSVLCTPQVAVSFPSLRRPFNGGKRPSHSARVLGSCCVLQALRRARSSCAQPLFFALLQSLVLLTRLQTQWDIEVDRAMTASPVRKPSFLRAFSRTFAWEMVVITFLLSVKCLIQLLQTQFLARLLTFYTSSTSTDLSDGYWYAAGIVTSTCTADRLSTAAVLSNAVTLPCCLAV